MGHPWEAHGYREREREEKDQSLAYQYPAQFSVVIAWLPRPARTV